MMELMELVQDGGNNGIDTDMAKDNLMLCSWRTLVEKMLPHTCINVPYERTETNKDLKLTIYDLLSFYTLEMKL